MSWDDLKKITWRNALVQIVALTISWMFAGYLMTFISLPMVLSVGLKYTLRFILKIVLTGLLFGLLAYLFPKWYTNEQFNIAPNIVTINEYNDDNNSSTPIMQDQSDKDEMSPLPVTNKGKRFYMRLCPGWLKQKINQSSQQVQQQPQAVPVPVQSMGVHPELLPMYLRSVPQHPATAYMEHMTQVEQQDLVNAYRNVKRDPFWGRDLTPLKTMYYEKLGSGIKETVPPPSSDDVIPRHLCNSGFITQRADNLGWHKLPWQF